MVFRFIYNLLFPVVFLAYLPGLLLKYARRGGAKSNYSERFGMFSRGKREELSKLKNPVWVHAVSVGETVVALSMIKRWLERSPGLEFVLSTTTTTGQALARSRAPEGVAVIFCPLDYFLFTRRTLRLVRPRMLVIFETEIWPNLIHGAKSLGAEVALVNARMSDNSHRGYKRFSWIFAPILRELSFVGAQSEMDAERFKDICGDLDVVVSGNMKFDQPPPTAKDLELASPGLDEVFGAAPRRVLLAASTHPGEEELLGRIFASLKRDRPDLRLVVVPRHAERGAEIAETLGKLGLKFVRRSTGEGVDGKAEVLLADTTGELLAFIAASDIVVMGKSFAGHDEGHNIIEPAALGKPVLTGDVARNFRQTLAALTGADAVVAVPGDGKLEGAIVELLDNPDKCAALGERARAAVDKERGATDKTIDLCEKTLN